MTYPGDSDEQMSLWNNEDGFYYDAISWGYGRSQQLPVRSMVGLMPLYATLVLEPGVINKFKGFKKRMDWFIENRPDISTRNIANIKGTSSIDLAIWADPVQNGVEETGNYLLWPRRKGLSRSCKRCWMRRSSCLTTAFDRMQNSYSSNRCEIADPRLQDVPVPP